MRLYSAPSIVTDASVTRVTTALMPQLALKLLLAVDDVLLAALFFLNHCLIFVRAAPLLARFSQSRLGPGAFFDVRMSTMSPFCST